MIRMGEDMPAPVSELLAVVVVPARDEEQRICACLQALAGQVGIRAAEFEVLLVLDGCLDATRREAEREAERQPGLRVNLIELATSRGVGRARGTGMDVACARLLQIGRPDGLIASTDADSVVAEDWLVRQLELVSEGAQAIGGLIELDAAEADLLPETALRARADSRVLRMRAAINRSDPGAPLEHHQFSGASLALTAAAYERCGGLPRLAALEDEALEAALLRGGIPIHRSGGVRVSTSARLDGRAPRGLAHDLANADWRARRCYRASQFPLEMLLEHKQDTVSLVIPTREVAATIPAIAAEARRLREADLFDRVLVVDADSRDGTAAIAASFDLEVVQEDEVLPEFGPALGKGDAMWRALSMIESGVVAFADGDSERLVPGFFEGLVGPLLCDPSLSFVKGTFRRPFRTGASVDPHGGGRVTELMARPLLNLHAHELAVFEQPLAGEVAARRDLLRAIPFSAGYGVEIAMLIDVWRMQGLSAMAQVDLGQRQNRHQTLGALSAMAYEVLVAAQSRFLGSDFADAHAGASMLVPGREGGRMQTRRVTIEERPPLDGRDGSATARRVAQSASEPRSSPGSRGQVTPTATTVRLRPPFLAS